jgi:hypothetical protein
MSADVIAFQKAPARTTDADFVRFNAATGIYHAPSGNLIAVRGPAVILRIIRESLDVIEEKAKRAGGMTTADARTLTGYVANLLHQVAHGYDLPDPT